MFFVNWPKGRMRSIKSFELAVASQQRQLTHTSSWRYIRLKLCVQFSFTGTLSIPRGATPVPQNAMEMTSNELIYILLNIVAFVRAWRNKTPQEKHEDATHCLLMILSWHVFVHMNSYITTLIRPYLVKEMHLQQVFQPIWLSPWSLGIEEGILYCPSGVLFLDFTVSG